MKKILHKTYFLLIVFLLSFSCFLQAQVYPVQVTPIAIPPYLMRLSDYTTTTQNKVNVQLLMLDISHPSRQVKLRMFFESMQGNFSVRSVDYVVGAPTIDLMSGSPMTLTTLDLKPYFEQNNLEGLRGNQYEQALPDGWYNLSFQVFDEMTNQPLSKKTAYPLSLYMSDPPLLNLPQDQAEIKQDPTPNIFFNWTPRGHVAGLVQYEFQLVEIWDNQVSPIQAFLSSPILWRETTRTTSLLYNMSKPALQAGKRYAWRVRAFLSDGINEQMAFNNDGYSEIHSFSYSAVCQSPQQVLAEMQGSSAASIHWQTSPSFDSYRIMYRKQGTNHWFTLNSTTDNVLIGNLETQTTYEYQVGGHCLGNFNTEDFTNTPIYTFTTNDNKGGAKYQCGATPKFFIMNKKPLASLSVNESFMAGDFSVTATQVSGGNGTFSGKGYISVPYLMDTKIGVNFNGIKINDAHQLYDGTVETAYDPDWKNVITTGEIANVVDGNSDQKIATVDFVIDTVIVDSLTGRATVIGTNGEKQIVTGGDTYEIKDKSGTIYKADAHGLNIIGKEVEGGKSDASNTNGISKGSGSNSSAKGGGNVVSAFTSKEVQLVFEASEHQKYGFDQVDPQAPDGIKKEYQSVTDADGNTVYLPYKSIVSNEEDDINVRIVKGKDQASKIQFMTLATGRKIDATSTDNGFTLHLKGVGEFEGETIIATITSKADSSRRDLVGAFNLEYLKSTSVKLVLVNAGGSTIPQVSDLQSYLNEVYRGAGVSFEVLSTLSINMDGIIPATTIHSGESGIFSHYTDDQKKVNNAIKSTPTYQANPTAYYIILTNKKPTPAQDEQGVMPLGKQFGYVYDGGNHTIAHELGHGVFQLSHPFDASSYGVPKGSTHWLMDYSGGDKLPFMQWKQVNKPKFRIGLFDADSTGEFSLALLTPTWKPFYFKGSNLYVSSEKIDVPNGAVHGINFNGKVYLWNNDKQGYYNTSDLTPLNINIIDSPEDNLSVALYWNKGQCGSNENYVSTWGYLKDKRGKLNLKQSDAGSVIFKGIIGCTSDKANKEIYFATNHLGSAYFDYAKSHAIKTDVPLSKNKDLIDALVAQVNLQKENSVKSITEFGEILADKLRTYELFNKKKFIVVSVPVNILSSDQAAWNSVAQQVFEKSELGKQDILITLPYVNCHGIIGDLGTFYYMPGLALGSDVHIDKSKLRSDYNNTQKVNDTRASNFALHAIGEFVTDIFTYTTKKVLIYTGVFNASNVIECSTHEFVASGYPYNKIIQLCKQKSYDELVDMINTQQTQFRELSEQLYEEISTPKYAANAGGRPAVERTLKIKQLDNELVIANELKKLSQETKEKDFVKFSPDDAHYIHIKEEFIDYPIPDGKYASIYKTDGIRYINNLPFDELREKIGYPATGNYEWEDQSHYFTNKEDFIYSHYVDPYVYSTLDVASVVLGFIGADVIPDAIGLCYASARCNYLNMAIYGIAVVIEGPESKFAASTIARAGGFVRVGETGVKSVNNVIDDQMRFFIKDNSTLFTTDDLLLFENKSGKDLQEAINNALRHTSENTTNAANKLLDDIYAKQEQIIKDCKPKILTLSPNQKGNFGEIVTDLFFKKKNYTPLHKQIVSIDAVGHQGIDAVFEKGGEFFIVESKYGTATLSTVKGDIKQMSDEWIKGKNRLLNAVGKENAKKILNVGYTRLLSKVDEKGIVTLYNVDKDGNVMGKFILNTNK